MATGVAAVLTALKGRDYISSADCSADETGALLDLALAKNWSFLDLPSILRHGSRPSPASGSVSQVSSFATQKYRVFSSKAFNFACMTS